MQEVVACPQEQLDTEQVDTEDKVVLDMVVVVVDTVAIVVDMAVVVVEYSLPQLLEYAVPFGMPVDMVDTLSLVPCQPLRLTATMGQNKRIVHHHNPTFLSYWDGQSIRNSVSLLRNIHA